MAQPHECVMRLRRALHEYVIAGIETNIPLHQRLLEPEPDFTLHPAFRHYDIHWLERFVGRALAIERE
jgi:acetyl-CoA carboxylase biotin carboxylase subunit